MTIPESYLLAARICLNNTAKSVHWKNKWIDTKSKDQNSFYLFPLS